MMKILFKPFSIVGGMLAGLLGKKIFEALWSMIGEKQTPDPEQRETPWRKLIPALLLQGAIFRAVRGAVDHGLRRAFSSVTGSWPGRERADPS
jgi:uncharacterized protein DUF4235